MRLQLDRLTWIELEPESEQKPIRAGGVTIDLFQRTISKDGRDVHLTPKEYAVLAELAKHPGRVLTHEHLLRTAAHLRSQRHSCPADHP